MPKKKMKYRRALKIAKKQYPKLPKKRQKKIAGRIAYGKKKKK